MADLRPSFPVLEDYTSGAGLALHKVAEGDAIASKNALAGLIAKDPDDKFRYLKVDADGHLIVSNNPDIAIISDSGTHAGDKTTAQPIVTLTLDTEKTYRNIDVSVSCFRDARFQVIQKNDAAETILIDGLRAGPGCETFAHLFEKIEFTTGATGDQELILKGLNLDQASTMDGFLGVDELQ